jgi:hypothetical protein
MAEAFPLTEAGINTTEDTPVVESSPPLNPKSVARTQRLAKRRNKRSRPITNTPSPQGVKPPQPGFNFNLNPIQFNPIIPPSVEKLAKQGQVSNSPFLNLVPATMNRNDLELPPKGAKPYRDYLDKDYEKEKDPKCAVAHYTMATLNKDAGNMKLTAFTPTFGMLLIRHFREEDQIILISNEMNAVLTNHMMTSHANQDSFANCKEEMITDAKNKAVEAAMISYKAHKAKFESQAPCTDEEAAKHHIDKFIRKVITNFGGDVANNLEELSYKDQDRPNNDKKKHSLLSGASRSSHL